jgi:hypothetical protein
MDHENLDPIKEFKHELNQEIQRRKKYINFDFSLAHFFFWLSIIASFTSAIIIAGDYLKEYKIIVSVIAGIPGLVVAIDKTFDFARRAAWGTMYKIDLQELKNDIDFGNVDIHKGSRSLREIMRKNESAFFRIGFFAKEKDGDSKKGQSERIRSNTIDEAAGGTA